MYRSGHRTGSWDPFSELRTLQSEMDRVFSGYDRGANTFPALNVWGNSEKAIVTAEIPGVDAENLDISVVKNQLTIKGERKADTPVEDVVCHRSERGVGRFVRTLHLPFDVENDKVSAKYEQGVLTITLPRSEDTKPRRISIENS